MTLQEAKQMRNLYTIMENNKVNEDFTPILQTLFTQLERNLRKKDVVQDILFNYSKNKSSFNIFLCEMGTDNNLQLFSELEYEIENNKELERYFLEEVKNSFKKGFKTEGSCTFIKGCLLIHDNKVYPVGLMKVYVQIIFS